MRLTPTVVTCVSLTSLLFCSRVGPIFAAFDLFTIFFYTFSCSD